MTSSCVRTFASEVDAKAFADSVTLPVEIIHIPYQPEERWEIPDSEAAEAELIAFGERGDDLAIRALAWLKASCWGRDPKRTLANAAECLGADVDEGDRCGAASISQAEKFLARINAAIRRAPKVSAIRSFATPEEWEVRWVRDDSNDGDSGSPWSKDQD